MSAPAFAVIAGLDALDAPQRQALFERGRTNDPGVAADVAAIIQAVVVDGDDALRMLARRFDGVALDRLEVDRAGWDAALSAIPGAVRRALEQAARAIAVFHEAQQPRDLEIEPEPGLRLGRRVEPLGRVGVYAPGGRAAYPSSVLMGVVPARVAGVGEIVVCSPPGTDGLPPAAVLAAAAIGGADRVFAVGGAGAIAAMAHGTASIPAVDRIVGPGNAYVAEAKRQLTGRVAIDSPAGPSEILVIADDTADADIVSTELIAQAEHDPDACCVLVTTHAALIDAVRARIREQLAGEPRRDIVARALATGGALLTAATMEDALVFSAQYAPEHLLLLTASPEQLLPRVRNAGTVFLGAHSSVAFGDYVTGANHVLPTGGLARSYSGLSTNDFMRFSTYQAVDARTAARLAAPAAALADAEGLPGHARAARLRAAAGAGQASTRAARSAPALRAGYRDLVAYDPGRAPCDVDLSDNTNLWGPNPAAAAAVRTAGDDALTRYPPVYVPALKRRLAALLGVEPDNIATGCGSDDVIDSAVRAFCAPGDAVAYPDPTFGMVSIFARMNVARPLPIPSGPGATPDADALAGARAAVTYLCRPNNPTGTLADAAIVERLESEAAGVLLVDEAYIDFAQDPGLAARAARSDRTVVLRTFSKAYGLAGLRLGFAVGPASLIAEIEKSRGPYKVSALAERAALALLDDGLDWVSARVEDVITNRARLARRLGEMRLRTLPSAANFLLVQLPQGATAADWNVQLRTHGVGIRPFAALPGLGECIRVTVGPWEQMERFLAALEAVITMSPQAAGTP